MAKKAFLLGAQTFGLSYTDRDLVLVEEAMVAHGFACEVHGAKNAKKNEVRDAFEHFAHNAKTVDTLIFYFSGHAIIDRPPLKLVLGEEQRDEVPFADFRSPFEQSPAQSKLIVLDCCHSGAAVDDWMLPESERFRILTATERRQGAKELDELQASFLAYHFHRLLTADARTVANREDGCIYLGSFYAGLLRAAKDHNAKPKANSVPEPNLRGNAKHDLPLGAVAKDARGESAGNTSAGHNGHSPTEQTEPTEQKVDEPEQPPVNGRPSWRITLGLTLAVFILHGAGVFDAAFGFDTRLRLVSSELLRAFPSGPQPDEASLVVIDEETEAALASTILESDGKPLGPFGARWRAHTAKMIARLAGAGADVIALDMDFPPQTDAVVAQGTAALAQAIRDARARGTAVVLLGHRTSSGMTADPVLRAALKDEAKGTGQLAHECLGIRQDGTATLPLLLVDRQKSPWPGVPALALAAVAAHWGVLLGAVRDEELSLNGSDGRVRGLPLAAYGSGRRIECPAMLPTDQVAQTLVQLGPNPARRNHPAAIAYEAVLQDGFMHESLRLVLVGAQLSRKDDSHSVFYCDAAPLSCGWEQRSGLNLHLDAINNLLAGKTLRALGPLTQLLLMIAYCACTLWLRRSIADRSTRRWALALLLAAQVLVAGLAVVYFHRLSDVLYPIAATMMAYWLGGRWHRASI